MTLARRSRRSSGSDLFDTAAPFRDLPLGYAIVAAAVVGALCEVAAPLLAPSYPHANGINFAAMFLPFIRIIGGLFAATILVFGLWGAARRWFDRRSDRASFDRQTGIDSIRRLSWQEFERVLGEAYRRRDYQVLQRGGPVADGGADLELSKHGERLLVQAKHWREWKVGVPQIRELWGAVADEHADGGIFITSGNFSREARRWTAKKNLVLVDGSELSGMISEILRTQGPSSAEPGERICRQCGRPMQLRTAKRGPSVGQEFWGCTGFPSCRHTEPVASPSPSSRH